MADRFVDYKGIKVYYSPELDGGGMEFGQDFIPVVRKRFGKVGRCCEFGAGPGFIGFSLLAEGLCEKLDLVEINEDAVRAMEKTIKKNRLEGVAEVFLSDTFKDVDRKRSWNLVVSNPPHFDGGEDKYTRDMRIYDPGWRIHREFYRDIRMFLVKGGSSLFVENRFGSSPKLWKNMIIDAGLKYEGSFRYKTVGRIPRFSDVVAYVKGEKGFTKKSSVGEVLAKTVLHAAYTIYYPYYFVLSKK